MGYYALALLRCRRSLINEGGAYPVPTPQPKEQIHMQKTVKYMMGPEVQKALTAPAMAQAGQ